MKMIVKKMPSRLRHGYARQGRIHPLHRVWRAMIQRCTNPRDPRFDSYGGRGIKVCDRWLTFENWLSDMGPRPPGKGPGGRAIYSLDRKDNDGDYEPGNCRWSTMIEQGANMSRNRWLEFCGETLTLQQWSRRLGMNRMTIHRRLQKGWSIERAFTHPVRGRSCA